MRMMLFFFCLSAILAKGQTLKSGTSVIHIKVNDSTLRITDTIKLNFIFSGDAPDTTTIINLTLNSLNLTNNPVLKPSQVAITPEEWKQAVDSNDGNYSVIAELTSSTYNQPPSLYQTAMVSASGEGKGEAGGEEVFACH